MKLLKENLVPTLIILIAGLLISFAAVPLQNTEWAEGMRAEADEHNEGSEAEGREGPPEGLLGGVLMVILPLVKVSLLMGIGVLLTTLVSWIIRRINGLRPSRAT